MRRRLICIVMILLTLLTSCGKVFSKNEPPSFVEGNRHKFRVIQAGNEIGHGGRRQHHVYRLLQFSDKPKFLCDRVDNERLSENLRVMTKEIGSRRVGTAGNSAANRFLRLFLENLGFSEENGNLVTQKFGSGGAQTENIIAILPSGNPNARILAISAHYDSVSIGEGAVDNASGVAALMELVRIVMESGKQYEFELRFCFFSGEENGYHGAYCFINKMTPDERARFIGNFNVDMAGHSEEGYVNYLVVSTKGVPSTGDSLPAEHNVISMSVDHAFRLLKLPIPNYCSPMNAGKHDAVPFYRNGIPVITLSWRELVDGKQTADFRYYDFTAPRMIHSARDILENLNIESVGHTTRLMVMALDLLNDQEKAPLI